MALAKKSCARSEETVLARKSSATLEETELAEESDATFQCQLCKERALEELARLERERLERERLECERRERERALRYAAFLRGSLVAGRADAAGTALYAQNAGYRCVEGHFRILPTQNEAAGDLMVSSLGVTTYSGPETDAADNEYAEAMVKALSLGINVLDTALNYRGTRSEVAVGRAIAEAIEQELITREQVVVCTKGGYLTYGTKRPENPRRWIQETYVKPGYFKWKDVVAGCHCLAPEFLKNQVDRSRKNLNVDTIDVYYIHNPEIQLLEIPRETFLRRIRVAFRALEEVCAEGKLSVYGTATWGGFRQPLDNPGHLSLVELVTAAQEAGGCKHHFRVVQLPYNFSLQDAANIETQMVEGTRMSLLDAAQKLSISVVASTSLMHASLCQGLAGDSALKFFSELKNDAIDAQCELHPIELVGDIQKSFTQLGKDATDAQFALQFVRTTPNILIGLASMRTMSHIEENFDIVLLSRYLRQSLELESTSKPSESSRSKSLQVFSSKPFEDSRSKSLLEPLELFRNFLERLKKY